MAPRRPSDQQPEDSHHSHLHSDTCSASWLADKVEDLSVASSGFTVNLARLEEGVSDLRASTKSLEECLNKTREELLNKLVKLDTIVTNQGDIIKMLHGEVYGNGNSGLKTQVAKIFAASAALTVVLSFIVNISFIFFSGK